jgi:hypothetical protein
LRLFPTPARPGRASHSPGDRSAPRPAPAPAPLPHQLIGSSSSTSGRGTGFPLSGLRVIFAVSCTACPSASRLSSGSSSGHATYIADRTRPSLWLTWSGESWRTLAQQNGRRGAAWTACRPTGTCSQIRRDCVRSPRGSRSHSVMPSIFMTSRLSFGRSGVTGWAGALCRSLGRGPFRGCTRPRDGHIVLALTSDMRHVRTSAPGPTELA